MSKPNVTSTNYASLIKAANQGEITPPAWLKEGEQIISKTHGSGMVVGFIGPRLVVNFPSAKGNSQVQFPFWVEAIASNEIAPATVPQIKTASNPTSDTKQNLATDNHHLNNQLKQKIKTISKKGFQAIATELQYKIISIDITQPNPGQAGSFPVDLHPAIYTALTKTGIKNLYSHQLQARAEIKAGKDIMLCTHTASGKTLCFNPPIMEHCLRDKNVSALYIYPLKALAIDQLSKLNELNQELPLSDRIRIGLMTGDVPLQERLKLFNPIAPQILAVSPDLLHHQIYKIKSPEWQTWQCFLKNLRYIVIDESHTYIGSFGMHFANLMRRLLLAIDKVGGNSKLVQFIFSSATIGNPQELAMTLSSRENTPERLTVIDQSGASSAERTIITLAPSETPNSDACRIVASWLRNDLSGIVFCNSRSALKNLFLLIQEQLNKEGKKYLAQKMAIFYGSILGERRQEIIQQLRSGNLKVILSTSALEAGIDLPELDCCLLRGYPGSLMSFKQRLGRAGRRHAGLIIYLPIATNTFDYYYGKNPQKLLYGKVESAACNPNYPTILSKHIECSAAESNIPINELTSRFGPSAGTIANILLKQEKLFLTKGGMIYARGYPHKDVSLRTNLMGTITVIDKETNDTLEEMSLDIAYREVYPQAIYTAQNDSGEITFYRAESLDLDLRKAILVRYQEDPYLLTKAIMNTRVKELSSLMDMVSFPTKIPNGALEIELFWGEITIEVLGFGLYSKDGKCCTNNSCQGYKKRLKGISCQYCGQSSTSVEVDKLIEKSFFQQPYQTTHQAPVIAMKVNDVFANVIDQKVEHIKSQLKEKYGELIPEEMKKLFRGDPVAIALHALEHQISTALPLSVLCSGRDVNGLCISNEDSSEFISYFYDTSDGGNGACEAIFEKFIEIAQEAASLSQTCDCDWGCPRCLFRSGCPHENELLHKQLGLFLINQISANCLRSESKS